MTILLVLMVVDHDGSIQARRTCQAPYRGGNIVAARSGARYDFDSIVLLRWRLTGTIWWFTTGIVELAVLRLARTFTGGKLLEGLVSRYYLVLSMWTYRLYDMET